MSTVIRDMRDVAGSSYTLGMVTAFLGLIAIVSPLFSGMSVTVLVGGLVAAAGISATYYALQAESFGGGVCTIPIWRGCSAFWLTFDHQPG